MKTSPRPNHAYLQAANLDSNTVSVSTAKPPEMGLADWMSHLRDWLDHHRIEPAGFKRSVGLSGNPTYEVSFHDGSEADLFAAEFSKEPLRQQALSPDDWVQPAKE